MTKKWITPRVEVVALEAERDVLATCFTASMSGKEHLVAGCRRAKCATYP